MTLGPRLSLLIARNDAVADAPRLRPAETPSFGAPQDLAALAADLARAPPAGSEREAAQSPEDVAQAAPEAEPAPQRPRIVEIAPEARGAARRDDGGDRRVRGSEPLAAIRSVASETEPPPAMRQVEPVAQQSFVRRQPVATDRISITQTFGTSSASPSKPTPPPPVTPPPEPETGAAMPARWDGDRLDVSTPAPVPQPLGEEQAAQAPVPVADASKTSQPTPIEAAVPSPLRRERAPPVRANIDKSLDTAPPERAPREPEAAAPLRPAVAELRPFPAPPAAEVRPQAVAAPPRRAAAPPAIRIEIGRLTLVSKDAPAKKPVAPRRAAARAHSIPPPWTRG